jgi:hypothetical protein
VDAARVSNIEAVRSGSANSVRWIPTPRYPDDDRYTAAVEADLPHANTNDPRLDAVADQRFQPVYQCIGVNTLQPCELRRDTFRFFHADDQMATSGVGEGGDVFQRFLFIGIAVAIRLTLVLDHEALGHPGQNQIVEIALRDIFKIRARYRHKSATLSPDV